MQENNFLSHLKRLKIYTFAYPSDIREFIVCTIIS